MDIIPLHNTADRQAWEDIYRQSFPTEELRPIPHTYALLRQDSRFHLLMGKEDNFIVSFIIYWQLEHGLYIDYLATHPQYRQRGHARTLLMQVASSSALPAVLEVELPDNDTAKKRIAFYKKCGFYYNGDFPYCMPNYNNEGFTPMALMSYPTALSTQQCHLIAGDIYAAAYNREWTRE